MRKFIAEQILFLLELNVLFYDYSEDDLEIMRRQLRTGNLFVRAVVKRCRYGHPRIVLLDPSKNIKQPELINYQAISNLLWLTCPYLNDEIHKLENNGYIQKISDFIGTDNGYKSLMKSSHANFYFLRNFVYWKFFGAPLEEEPMDIFTKGIGGTAELNSLKCLHMQFCHYSLYSYNVAGYMTAQLIGRLDCGDVRCAQFL